MVNSNNTAYLKQFDEIVDLYNKNKLHHAWLFAGITGLGKFEFSKNVSKFILSYGALDGAQNAKLIDNGSHPDLYIVDKENDTIKVDDIREVHHFIQLTPALSKNKVIIINNSHNLNSNAANALLKILEEPPANTYLFLICSGFMIPTIRSRCISMSFSPLSFEAFKDRCKSWGIGDEDMSWIYSITRGSIGIAEKLRDAGNRELVKSWENILRKKASLQELIILKNEMSSENISLFMQMFDELVLQNLKQVDDINEVDDIIYWYDNSKKLLSEGEIFNFDNQNVIFHVAAKTP